MTWGLAAWQSGTRRRKRQMTLTHSELHIVLSYGLVTNQIHPVSNIQCIISSSFLEHQLPGLVWDILFLQPRLCPTKKKKANKTCAQEN